MHAILPDECSWDMHRNADETVKIRYSETFNDLDVVKRTYDILKSAVHMIPGDVQVQCADNTIILHGTVSMATAANMIVGEMLHWSPLSKMTVSDLLIGSLAAGVQAGRTASGDNGAVPQKQLVAGSANE